MARDDLVPGSRYTSGRAAALGDAFLPLGDDPASSLFYNPANIGRVHRFLAEPINFALNLNSNTLGTGTKLTGVTSLPSYLPNLEATPGLMHGAGWSLLSSLAAPGFAFGILWDNQFGATADGAGTVTNRSRYQLIPAFATGTALLKGLLRVGYSVQWVNQASGGTSASSATDTLAYNQGLAQGSALSHNLGMAITLPTEFLPSVNIVVRNLLTASYVPFTLMSFTSSSTGVPSADPMSIDASFSATPTLGGGASMNLVMEGRDLLNVSGVSIVGRIALGAEFVLKNKLYIRGGLSSGYYSGGVGFRGKNGAIDLSWYSVEVSSRYLGQRDVRYMLQYQIRNF